MNAGFSSPFMALPAPNPQAAYAALCAKDAGQDGVFYVGVTSTGIYCRPVCRVRTPKFENCRFYASTLLAQAAGFRPCRRCRPELAPAAAAWSVQDVSHSLAQAAVRLLAPARQGRSQAQTLSVKEVAEQLGISERHLHRVMLGSFGVGPKEYAQQARISLARRLVVDTTLPLPHIAETCGYGTMRGMQREFARLDGRAPDSLRKAHRAGQDANEQTCFLAYRPPYAMAPLLKFLAERAVSGMEVVDFSPNARIHWAHSLTLATPQGVINGWVRVRFEPEQHRLRVHLARSLQAYLPEVQAQVSAVFDVGAPVECIAQALAHAPFAVPQGLRVPGALDTFELLVRAVLGQQVTVAAGNTLLARFTRAFGQSLTCPVKGLDWRFPLPSEFLARGSEVEQAMGALGIIKMRQQAIRAGALALHEGALDLRPGADVHQALQVLQALPGFGPWTAHYVVMRTLKWPDAWMPIDVALHQALGLLADKPRAALTQRIQQSQKIGHAWQHWRSYGMMAAWHSLDTSASKQEHS